MTGSPENYKGQYASLKFEPYKHREFPKAVYVEGKLIGTANNLMEEKEIYAARGIEREDIDPMTSLRDENAELKAKLAQFESGQPAVGRTAGVKTNTIEMLPAGAGSDGGAKGKDDASPQVAPKSGLNPLLAGKPSPQGTAPEVKTQINPGV